MKLSTLVISQIAFSAITLNIACAPEPNQYSAGTNKAATADHGPDPESISAEAMKKHEENAIKTSPVAEMVPAKVESPAAQPADPKPVAQVPTQSPPAAPAPTPSKPVVTDPAPAAGSDEQAKFAAMIKAGEVLSTYDVTTYQAWGTSAEKRIEVAIAVDAAGKPVTLRSPMSTQVVSSVDGKKEGSFGTGLHSALRVCNKSDKPIYLHSGRGSPFSHAEKPIKIGDCAKFLVENASAVKDGANYDHAAGEAKENWVYLRIKKIKPDGSVMK